MSAPNGWLTQLFLRYAPPLAGLGRLPLVGPCARWISAKLVPRDTLAWVQVQSGFGQGLWLRLNPRTGREYFEGAVEPEVQKVLEKYLRPGMTFYDLGANIGFFSLLAARLVGEEGRIIGFEADPELAVRLREHVARNRFQSISVQEKGVWSETRLVSFARIDPSSSPDRGWGHVDLSSMGDNTLQIPAVSLDDFTRDASAPDFLKCDVEGAEVDVFRGARNLLSQKRPIILCEMHSEENRRALIELWTSLGYVCRPCAEYHVLALPQ